MNPLTPIQRRELRAKAHHLEPSVIVGQHGLTPAVLHEIDLALLAHDLVKVRVLGDDRDKREAMLAKACTALDCAPVQHLGKVLVLWRPNPERKAAKKAAAAKPAKAAKPKPPPRSRKKTPLDPIRERRRAQPREATVASLRRTQQKDAVPTSRRRSRGST